MLFLNVQHMQNTSTAASKQLLGENSLLEDCPYTR